jgi:hypothetical protein
MERTLAFIGELARDVPFYELAFVPDQSAVDEVLEHVERENL